MSLTSIVVSRIVDTVSELDRNDVCFTLEILSSRGYKFTEQQIITLYSSGFNVDVTLFPHIAMVLEIKGYVGLKDIVRINTEQKLGHISPAVVTFFLKTKASPIVDALEISSFIDDALDNDAIDINDVVTILVNIKDCGFFYDKDVLDVRLTQHIALFMQSGRCMDIRKVVINKMMNARIPTFTNTHFIKK